MSTERAGRRQRPPSAAAGIVLALWVALVYACYALAYLP
jgi:hypothetical protein